MLNKNTHGGLNAKMLDAGKDDEGEDVRNKYGLAAIRQVKHPGIAHEEWDQGIPLTQEDLAFKLLNSNRIKRNV